MLGPEAVVIVTRRGADGSYSYLLPSTVWTIPLSSILDWRDKTVYVMASMAPDCGKEQA
jgi:hypothetical protein